jgi:acyl carrier protein
MTVEASKPVLDVIRAEVRALLSSQSITSIERATLIKELLDSMLFVGLLVRVEKYFSIEISDQTIYENSIVTFGDLADCVYAQRLALDKQAVGSS